MHCWYTRQPGRPILLGLGVLATTLALIGWASGQEFIAGEEIFRLPTGPPALELPAPTPLLEELQAEELPPPESAAADPAVAAAAPEVIVIPEAAWDFWSPQFWDPWEGSVELGLNGTEGNTQTFNVRFGFKAKHKTEYLVRSLEFTSIQKTASGVTTANTALLDGRIEWPMPKSRWNYYIHGLTEYDEFKAFDYRISADTGPGYEFIQTPWTTWIGRGGVSASHEIGGPSDKVNPEVALGSEFKHRFNEMHSINAKVDYYPNVTEFSDFRLNSQAGWEIALSKVWGLSLKLSVIDRYDSTPQGAKPNDLDYSTLLIWVF
jgi:putative salt-induced outer membrane protein YdiY